MIEAFLSVLFQLLMKFLKSALTILLLIIQKVKVSAKELNETDSKSKRNAPALLYPVATSTGIEVAIAIPVEDEISNLFVSYNFEMNYNMVNIAPESFPGPLLRFQFTDNKTKNRKIVKKSLKEISEVENKTVFTRTGLYRVFINRLNA